MDVLTKERFMRMREAWAILIILLSLPGIFFIRENGFLKGLYGSAIFYSLALGLPWLFLQALEHYL